MPCTGWHSVVRLPGLRLRLVRAAALPGFVLGALEAAARAEPIEGSTGPLIVWGMLALTLLPTCVFLEVIPYSRFPAWPLPVLSSESLSARFT